MVALIIVVIISVIALLAEILKFKKILYPLSTGGILGALIANILEWNNNFSWKYSDNMLVFDNIALAFSSVLLITMFLWFMMSKSYFNDETNLVEHTSLVLFSLIGAMVLTAFNNLVTLFLGIEILSIPMYLLSASHKKNILSNEAGFKYLIMGSFASGFLLFGIALLYGMAGSFDLNKVQTTLQSSNVPYFAYTSIIMILVALAFKVSLAPFHFWTPDVYEGSPIAITALMSTIVKTSVFVAIMRLFLLYFYPAYNHYIEVIAGLIVLSLIISNFSALKQTNIKRLLAFSSISHASIMMLLIIANVRNNMTVNALLYYTFAYSVASIIAFAIIQFVAQSKEETLNLFSGLMYEQPVLSIMMIITMFSMAGVPITAGFFAKYYILSALLMSPYKWLIIALILASIISVVYYLRIILVMFEKNSKKHVLPALDVSKNEWLVLTISIILLLIAGVYPDVVGNVF